MVRKSLLFLFCAVMMIPVVAGARQPIRPGVDVRILSDQGTEFARYRTSLPARHDGRYFYLEAVEGQRYSVQIANRTNRRIGVVVAVDGRNIINGAKSVLASDERMYIIGPRQTNTFEGWRTAMDRTNRFYFTSPSDSYAEKVFSDGSAMGTIAVAVFREKTPPPVVHQHRQPSVMKESAPSPQAPSASGGRMGARDEAKKSEQAGTGFGETTYSPSRVVTFESEPTAAERIVFKYEWRSELCKRGIVTCGLPVNRFWPEQGEYAPVPRDFRE